MVQYGVIWWLQQLHVSDERDQEVQRWLKALEREQQGISMTSTILNNFDFKWPFKMYFNIKCFVSPLSMVLTISI